MIPRALRFLSAEVRGLQAAAYILAACALLSSLLALVRDRLLAHSFGAGPELDAYYAAFRIPDLIFVALGALVSVYMLIPALTRRSEREQRDYIDTIVTGFSAIAIAISAAAAFIAPMVLPLLFPVLAAGPYADELVLLTRIMLVQPILLGFSNILAAITQVRHRYALYALAPLLYNLGIILGITVFYPVFGLAGLAWGVALGAAFHFGIQIPSAVNDGFFARMPRLRQPRALLETITVSLPRALALSMNQLTFLGLTSLAALLSTGSVAVYMFAYNLQAVPLSIIGASYSVAAFPTLAAAISSGERNQFIQHVALAARYVFFWSLPAIALIVVLRAHIVRVILGSGAFDWTDTRLTAAAFALFSLSLAAQGLTLLLVRGYYAAGRSFVPFAAALGTALLALGLGGATVLAFTIDPVLVFVEQLLRVEDLQGSEVLALAFAYSFATILGALFLLIHFSVRYRGFFPLVVRSLLESVIAALVAGLGAYIYLAFASEFDASSTALSIFVQGFSAGLCGMALAALTYYLMGNQEYGGVYTSIKERLWSKPADVPVITSAEQ